MSSTDFQVSSHMCCLKLGHQYWISSHCQRTNIR